MVQFGKPNPSALVQQTVIVAEEEDDFILREDVIPGPSHVVNFETDDSTTHHHHGQNNNNNNDVLKKVNSYTHMDVSKSRRSLDDSNRGGMASRKDLSMPAEEFAEGCKLLQQAALGNKRGMESILTVRPHFVNFRDYDRRTALHVAASEGHLESCMYLIAKGAKKNRSDRWGGSPLDDGASFFPTTTFPNFNMILTPLFFSSIGFSQKSTPTSSSSYYSVSSIPGL